MSASTTTGRGFVRGPRRDQSRISPPRGRLRRSVRRRSIRGPSPGRSLRVRRSAQPPGELPDGPLHLRDLVGRELAEVLAPQQLLRAPGQREVEQRRLVTARVVSLGSRQRARRRGGRERRAPELAALAHRAQVERGRTFGGLPPEDLEGLVETGHLVAAAHAERPRGMGEVAPGPDRHVVERGDEVEHAVRARVEPEAAQDAPEGEDVGQELPVHPAARTRSTIARAASPRTFSTSSWYLSRIPSVSPTTSASSARRSSATRAAAQSSVSAMPGSL